MKAIRYYRDQEWAVRRWDKFNDGEQEPRSFCQFWRTVLLWATLASVPIVGQLFLTHLKVVPPLAERIESQAAFDRRLDRVKRISTPFARVVWLLLWPVRQAVYWIGQAIVNVVAFVDEQDTTGLDRIINVAAIVLLVLIGLAGLALLGMYLYMAWVANWVIFLLVASSIPTGVVLSTLALYYFGPPFLGAVLGTVELLWDVAVTSKHRICPPIAIVRGEDV